MVASNQPTILFAGGGTAGHIYPNVAILERLREMDLAFNPVFLVSERPVDAKALDGIAANGNRVPLPAQPPSKKPWHWPQWYGRWRASTSQVLQLIRDQQVQAAVVTGGYVSVPVARAVHQARIPLAMTNLDAVPGKANRVIVRWADRVFTAYDHESLGAAEHIGPLLRRVAVGPPDVAVARTSLGLDPTRQTLLVCGGSQGAKTINDLLIHLAGRPEVSALLAAWQVLHLAGEGNDWPVREAYEKAGIRAVVLPYCDRMGHAWRSADLAISRSGAGSVAEVQANRVPTIFLPFPHHRDEHQKLNAQPLAAADACILLRDRIHPGSNAGEVQPVLEELIAHPQRLAAIRQNLGDISAGDGAEAVAKWIAQQLT